MAFTLEAWTRMVAPGCETSRSVLFFKRFTLELRGGNQVRDQAVALLQRVGLGERLAHYPAQLSGGEQQRVALARAFINQPKILFADEPTGNLDAETGGLIIDCLFGLNAGSGTTLVLVTHDADLAQRAQKIIRLKGGLIVTGEPPHNV